MSLARFIRILISTTSTLSLPATMSFRSLFLAATGLAGVLAAPATDLDKRQSQTITESTTGNAGKYLIAAYIVREQEETSLIVVA